MSFLSIHKAIKMALDFQALVIYIRAGFPGSEEVVGVEAEDPAGRMAFRVKT